MELHSPVISELEVAESWSVTGAATLGLSAISLRLFDDSADESARERTTSFVTQDDPCTLESNPSYRSEGVLQSA